MRVGGGADEATDKYEAGMLGLDAVVPVLACVWTKKKKTNMRTYTYTYAYTDTHTHRHTHTHKPTNTMKTPALHTRHDT